MSCTGLVHYMCLINISTGKDGWAGEVPICAMLCGLLVLLERHTLHLEVPQEPGPEKLYKFASCHTEPKYEYF